MRTSVRQWCLTLLAGYPWISAFLAGCGKTIEVRQNAMVCTCGTTEEYFRRMLKKAVQQGRSE